MKTDSYTLGSGYHSERLSVFDDSLELAQHHHQAAEDAYDNGLMLEGRLSEETRDQILGLWLLAKECVRKIDEMEQEMQKPKIKKAKIKNGE